MGYIPFGHEIFNCIPMSEVNKHILVTNYTWEVFKKKAPPTTDSDIQAYQCYSRPRPHSVSPCKPTIPPIPVSLISQITLFNLQIIISIASNSGTASRFLITYQSFLPILWVTIPWMLDK